MSAFYVMRIILPITRLKVLCKVGEIFGNCCLQCFAFNVHSRKKLVFASSRIWRYSGSKNILDNKPTCIFEV